jgi:hypothetical protein
MLSHLMQIQNYCTSELFSLHQHIIITMGVMGAGFAIGDL